jgi:D-amino-acid dehydrogenase
MTPDVIVVGGGAVGVTAAYELARRGCAVTLLERGPTLAAGCSAGNAGLISPSHSAPLANPAAGRELARSLLRRDAPLSLRARPELLPWLARFAASCREAPAARGRAVLERFTAASLELHAELAALGTSFERRGILDMSRTGTVFHENEAHVDPERYVQAVGEAAAAAGAVLRTGVDARSLRSDELSAGSLVLAAGVWTAALARSFGVFVPLAAGKGYHVELEPSDGDPDVPMLLHEARLSVTPFPDRIRIAGRVELTGIEPAVDPGRPEAILDDALGYLPALRGRKVVHTWAGLRPCTPDGLPVIGAAPGNPRVLIATGHAMKGVALAPVTARALAEFVTGEPPSHELGPFSPGRFRPLLRRR